MNDLEYEEAFRRFRDSYNRTLSKEEIRSRIIEGSSKFAQFPHSRREHGISYSGKLPTITKLGVGDKYILNMIIDEIIEDLPRQGKYWDHTNCNLGAKFLTNFYYPQYGMWDELELKAAFENDGGEK